MTHLRRGIAVSAALAIAGAAAAQPAPVPTPLDPLGSRTKGDAVATRLHIDW